MEATKHATTALYLFECKAGHRIYRRDQLNKAGCSRCDGSQLHFLTSIPREDGETEIMHQIRTLAWKKPRVN